MPCRAEQQAGAAGSPGPRLRSPRSRPRPAGAAGQPAPPRLGPRHQPFRASPRALRAPAARAAGPPRPAHLPPRPPRWEALLLVMDNRPFPDLRTLVRQANESRVSVYAEWISYKYEPKTADKQWSEGYHGKLYNLTDDAVRACPRHTHWVIITNGDNDYDARFMSEVRRAGGCGRGAGCCGSCCCRACSRRQRAVACGGRAPAGPPPQLPAACRARAAGGVGGPGRHGPHRLRLSVALPAPHGGALRALCRWAGPARLQGERPDLLQHRPERQRVQLPAAGGRQHALWADRPHWQEQRDGGRHDGAADGVQGLAHQAREEQVRCCSVLLLRGAAAAVLLLGAPQCAAGRSSRAAEAAWPLPPARSAPPAPARAQVPGGARAVAAEVRDGRRHLGRHQRRLGREQRRLLHHRAVGPLQGGRLGLADGWRQGLALWRSRARPGNSPGLRRCVQWPPPLVPRQAERLGGAPAAGR